VHPWLLKFHVLKACFLSSHNQKGAAAKFLCTYLITTLSVLVFLSAQRLGESKQILPDTLARFFLVRRTDKMWSDKR